MPFQAYFSHGKDEEEEKDPTPGIVYWVVVRAGEVEMAFRAMLTTSIKRNHHPIEQDRTPSYQFDNGVVLHGSGIRFFKKMPDEPLKSLWFCTIYRAKEADSKYEVTGLKERFGEERSFSDLSELKIYLESQDVDASNIPQDDFTGERTVELRA